PYPPPFAPGGATDVNGFSSKSEPPAPGGDDEPSEAPPRAGEGLSFGARGSSSSPKPSPPKAGGRHPAPGPPNGGGIEGSCCAVACTEGSEPETIGSEFATEGRELA